VSSLVLRGMAKFISTGSKFSKVTMEAFKDQLLK